LSRTVHEEARRAVDGASRSLESDRLRLILDLHRGLSAPPGSVPLLSIALSELRQALDADRVALIARDSAGRLLATLEDYEAVRELLAEILAEGVEATVAPAIRETVEAIGRILTAGSDEVSISQLAQVMGLDKSAVSRRAAAAVQQGLLWNREDRKGRPARLCLGEPIPAGIGILPTREVLHGCSVDRGGLTPLPPT